MAHVQVVTVHRLAHAHAPPHRSGGYNAFKPRPSSPGRRPGYTDSGGSRRACYSGQAMLEVSSPDYSQLLDAYLKAADSPGSRSKTTPALRIVSAPCHRPARSGTGGIGSQSGSRGSERRRGRNEDSRIKNPASLATSPASAQIPVLAPIGGEVVERLVSPGQVVQAGQTQAFTISDLSTVWVLANVYQADLAFVRSGQDVSVETTRIPRHFTEGSLMWRLRWIRVPEHSRHASWSITREKS